MSRYRVLLELAPRGPWQFLRVAVGDHKYWLSWNGQRLSRSGDLRRFCTRYPDVAEDLATFLETELQR